MGMFDKPQYLTGKADEGYVKVGETFWLFNGRLDGTVNINGKTVEQVKLLVSKTRDGEQVAVFSGGAGIINQVKRMNDNDRRNMPVEVRLDEIDTGKGNPAHVLTPAGQATPVAGVADEEVPF